jgi:hypothetical protein
VTVAGSSTALTSSPNPSTIGQSVTFTATVTCTGFTPAGSVTFKDGTTTLGSATLSAGQAQLTTTSLAVGSHSITAIYSGDGNCAASTSPPLIQTVNQVGTGTALTSSQNPSMLGQSVTFTATVTCTGFTPTGSVTFLDGATTLGTAPLNGAGVATFATSALTLGSHTMTASYGGDGNCAPTTSAPLTQTVNAAGGSVGLVSSLNPSIFGQPVTFTATVACNGFTPTGSVTFRDGALALATVPLSGGVAGFTTPALGLGVHPMTAAYSGDANCAAGASVVLTQAVNPTGSQPVGGGAICNPVTCPLMLPPGPTGGGAGGFPPAR